MSCMQNSVHTTKGAVSPPVEPLYRERQATLETVYHGGTRIQLKFRIIRSPLCPLFLSDPTEWSRLQSELCVRQLASLRAFNC